MTEEDFNINLSNIDTDKILAKRKLLLIIVSVLLISFQFTAATISEVNTFIFKIEFGHQEGLSLIIFMALIYLFVRYVSCAHKYHRKLVELAYASLVDEPYIFKEYRDERGSYEGIGGLVTLQKTDGVNVHSFFNQNLGWELRYIKKGLFKRYFVYVFKYDEDGHPPEPDKYENIWKVYGSFRFLRVLLIEWKVKINSLLIHRQFLDILGPYFISFFAIISFIFPEFVGLILFYSGIKDVN